MEALVSLRRTFVFETSVAVTIGADSLDEDGAWEAAEQAALEAAPACRVVTPSGWNDAVDPRSPEGDVVVVDVEDNG